MKNTSRQIKYIFTVLAAASLLAIAGGTYLGVALGMVEHSMVSLLSAAGILLWAEAWGEFLAMCLRLRRGTSAFTADNSRTLNIIGWCMAGLAAVTFAAAIPGSTREPGCRIIETALLPGFFLAVGMAAKILRRLLTHAMALEEEQEGVV